MRNLVSTCGLFLATTAFAFGLWEQGVVSGRPTKDPATERAEAADAWLSLNYWPVVNKLLPIGPPPGPLPEHVQWAVTVRILPPHEEREHLLSLEKLYGGQVRAKVVAPKGSSIVSQLRALLERHPGETWEQISERVCVEDWTSTHADSHRLQLLAREFEALRISPVLPDELRLHQTGYEIVAQARWGSQVVVRMDGPGGGALKQPHPLLRWAEAFRRWATTHRPPGRVGSMPLDKRADGPCSRHAIRR